LAHWLNAEVTDEDIVITDLSPLVQYYNDIDFFFLDKGDSLYRPFACDHGTKQRWTDLPLLYTTDALAPIVASGQRVVVLLFPRRKMRLQREAAMRGWRTQEISVPTPGVGNVLIINPE
jgi:hypothetical protein